jgi:hypothetical protein
MCKEMLQNKVDKVVADLNKLMSGLEYNDAYQEFSFDRSEEEWGIMLIGKKSCLQELNDDLDWSKLDDRFDVLDMGLFRGEEW